MSYKHQGLAAGRWNELSLLEQMGNIGSESILAKESKLNKKRGHHE